MLLDQIKEKLSTTNNDFIYGDGVDVNRRSKGITPIREEYQQQVNLKRFSLGFLPLAKNGMPVDGHRTQEYCKKMIFALLCYNKTKGE